MARYSRHFILNRAQKTCAVAEAISSSWQWDQYTLAQLNQARIDCEVRLDVMTGLEMAAEEARGFLDESLDAAYAIAVSGIGLARARYDGNKPKMRIVSKLDAVGNSRPAKRETCKRWAAAWSQLDALWSLPLASGALSLAGYQAQRIIIEGNDTATPPVPGQYDSMELAVQHSRSEAEDLNEDLNALETLMERWYAAGTAVFAAGTAEGDQIRGQIPTTYNPNQEPLPIPPTPSGVSAALGSEPNSVDGVCLPATYADEYVWTLTPVAGSPETIQIVTATHTVTFTDVFNLSNATLTVAARNATGISAASAPVNVST